MVGRFFCFVVTAAVIAPASRARGEAVNWNIDPVLSSVRLSIGDQPIAENLVVQFRDATNSTQWSDAGGARAFLDGTLATNYVEGTSLEFLAGASDIVALEQGSYRPNPAAFDPGLANDANPDGRYANISTAPAAFGGRLRLAFSEALTFDGGFFSLVGVDFAIGSGVVALDTPASVNNTFAGGTTTFGYKSLASNLDALNTLIGQLLPDNVGLAWDPESYTNDSGGTVTTLGGNARRLDYNVNAQFLLQINSFDIIGTVTGTIVGFATVAGVPTLPGDVNHDNVVNGQDISIVASNWLHSGANVPGDANGDNVVNGQDISVIASHWLQSVGPAAGAAVPEPSALVLAMFAGAVLALRRCARKPTTQS